MITQSDYTLANIVDVPSLRKWLQKYIDVLVTLETPGQMKQALTAIDLATEYVRQLKLGVTIEMEVVEAAVLTEYALGQALVNAKRAGEWIKGGRPPKKLITNNDKFSLEKAGITLNESSHAQRYVEYEQKFGIESLKELVREKKLNQSLSRSAVYKTIDQALRRIEHQEKEQPSGPVTGPFDLILADPPWQYDVASTESRAIENQYSTLTLEEIKKHIPDASGVSVLFLWATAPKLCQALEVMAVWNFSYRTHAVWDKQVMGMGYWFRGQHELLLVGTRGKFSPPEEFLRVSSIFSEKRSGHSSKPECVYEWIEHTFPSAKKLEMYARTKRENWALWGTDL